MNFAAWYQRSLPIAATLPYHPYMKPMTPSNTQERQVLSVSQLNRKAKQLLETHLPMLWVEGEISNFSRPSSGHWYLSLKDQQAQLRGAMFKGRNQGVRFRPENGQKVMVRGRISLYEGRGDYQLIIEHMQLSGEGDLQQAFEQLKHKLNHEGLFETANKKPIPENSQHIGVVSSATGAAIHDILTVLKRRNPAAKVSIFPVAVQGPSAAPQIAKAIELANHHQACDVLIIGRGGGSLEDLWAFNEELVARAIANSLIPTVSAVGHEVDFTIADFCANHRAATPSAAAELVSPEINQQIELMSAYQQVLKQAVMLQLQQHHQQLKLLSTRLRHPGDKLRQQAQALDHLEQRLLRSMQLKMSKQRQTFTQLQHRSHRCNPSQALTSYRTKLKQMSLRQSQTISRKLENQATALQHQAQLLHSVSPLSTLNRGYSIIKIGRGKLLDNASKANVGDSIEAQLKQGKLHCEIKAIEL